MSSYPEDLKYTESHEWVRQDGDLFVVGISDFAQNQLGDIVYVELPDTGENIKKGEAIGELESSKAVSEINMPFSGEIIDINEELDDAPELINSNPFDSWIVKFMADNPEDFNTLLNSTEIKKIAEAE